MAGPFEFWNPDFKPQPGAPDMLGLLGAGLLGAAGPLPMGQSRGLLIGQALQAALLGGHQAKARLLQEAAMKQQQQLVELKIAEAEREKARETKWNELFGSMAPSGAAMPQSLLDQSLALPGQAGPTVARGAAMDQIQAASPVAGVNPPPTAGIFGGLPPELLRALGPQAGGKAMLDLFAKQQENDPARLAARTTATEGAKFPFALKLEEAKANAKQTSAMQNAAALGLKPGMPEFDRYIREATSERPTVKIDLGQQAEVEKTKALWDVHKKRLETMQGEAQQFADLEPRLNAIVLGLESGNVETGPVREALFPLRQALKDVGFTVDEKLPQAEQVRSAMSFIAPRMRVVGSGATSDMEMREFRKAGPQYSNTVEGNILLGRSFSQIQARNRSAYDLALKYAAERGTLQGVDDAIDRALGPVFPQPTTQAEYDAIQPGTVYFDRARRAFLVKRK